MHNDDLNSGTTPQASLISLFRRKSGGSEPPAQLLKRICAIVEPRGLGLEGFIRFLAEGGHVLGSWTNPAGLLTQLAREYAKQSGSKGPLMVVFDPLSVIDPTLRTVPRSWSRGRQFLFMYSWEGTRQAPGERTSSAGEGDKGYG